MGTLIYMVRFGLDITEDKQTILNLNACNAGLYSKIAVNPKTIMITVKLMSKTQKVIRYVTAFKLTALAAAIALAGCSQDDSAAKPAAIDAQLPAQESASEPVKAIAMTDAKMAERAKAIRSQVSLDLADGLDMTLWASEDLMADPVALSMDNQGRAWVAITHRSNNSEFDIRPYPHWLTDSIAMESNEDRREFLHKTFAADKNLTEKDVPDRNAYTTGRIWPW